MSNDDRVPVKLFIDTNVYLDFYRLSSADLTKLEQLVELAMNTGDIELYVTEHQVNEFYRNRETVISKAIKEAKNNISLPPIYSGHNKYEEVKREVKLLNQRIMSIHQDTLREANEGTLKADGLVGSLFSKQIPLDTKIYNIASKRSRLRNPPGKTNSVGDAINWETLLNNVEPENQLNIISVDGDFASPLNKGKIHDFLHREWKDKKNGEVRLYENLNGFFKDHFEDIKLLDEYVKERLISKLSQSKSFDEARKTIKKMYLDKSYNLPQARAVILAAATADQVYRANEYSPASVGDKLMEIILPHWDDVGTELQELWKNKFPSTIKNIDIDSEL